MLFFTKLFIRVTAIFIQNKRGNWDQQTVNITHRLLGGHVGFFDYPFE